VPKHPAGTNRLPTPASDLASAADQERARILRADVLSQPDIKLHPLGEADAARELAQFTRILWSTPKMEGYFDRQHLTNLKHHLAEARHGFATLARGGILEVLVIPTLPEDAMGFHLLTVHDPRDDADRGRVIGYTVYSLEKGHAPFGQAEAVRVAFDIFPGFREGRYREVPFTNCEIYNVSRKILYRYRPERFLVDAKTQISQTRTGDPFKRTIYYLKRGYYPPDLKPAADACLVHLLERKPLARSTLRALVANSKAAFWVFPARLAPHRPTPP